MCRPIDPLHTSIRYPRYPQGGARLSVLGATSPPNRRRDRKVPLDQGFMGFLLK